MIPQAAVEAAPVQVPAPLPPLPPLPAALPQTPVIAGAPLPSAFTYEGLQARGGELSRQLRSAAERRSNLLDELRNAPNDATREGIQSRITLLDQRLLQIEGDIAENGQALARAAAQRAGTTEPSRGRDNDGPPRELMGVLAFFLLAPMAFAMTRRLWRSGSRSQAPQRDPESEARLERIEQAVDAIAIEVERVSEGQRFQNKLLGEGQGVPAFGFARSREGEQVGG